MPPKYDRDAQQDLMEKSLTNVRALLDKIEAEEASQKRTHVWVAASIAATALALVGIVGLALYFK
jgi:hypothetical protein